MSRPKCNEIWMCNLKEHGGSVQSGHRPVFVISNDKNNTYSPTLNIIPLTSKMNKRRLPIHVELWHYQDYGLRAPSTMLVEQTTTVPVEDLYERIGEVSDDQTINSIRKAIMIQFPILNFAH